MVRTAELDAGEGPDAAADHGDEQRRCVSDQQLSRRRSQAAAAVAHTTHPPDREQGKARQDDRGDQRRREPVRQHDHNRSRREHTQTGQGGRPRRAEFVGINPELFARHRVERRLAVLHDGRRDALGVQSFGAVDQRQLLGRSLRVVGQFLFLPVLSRC